MVQRGIQNPLDRMLHPVSLDEPTRPSLSLFTYDPFAAVSSPS